MNQSEFIAKQLKTNILYQLTTARQFLINAEQDRQKTVHEVRKCLKRARAYVRLLTAGVNSEKADKLENQLRKLGRQFTVFRESTANFNTFIKHTPLLLQRFPQDEIDQVRVHLESKIEIIYSTEDFTDHINKAIQILDRLELLSNELEVEKIDRIRLFNLLSDSFKYGKRTYKATLKSFDPINAHEFRKAVKQLQFQTNLLRKAEIHDHPDLVDQLDRIADALGNDHDLYILLDSLEKEKVLKPKNRKRAVFALLSTEILNKRREALKMADSLYSMKSKEFLSMLLIPSDDQNVD